jgi:acyl-CoA reductase-like NAD-dependent aldehyde dehydrogenase
MPENNGRLNAINPTMEERVEEILASSREDVGATVEAARWGQWERREVSGLERAELFHGLSRSLRNRADTDNDDAPFGGQRGSGVGRELGHEGLETFQESKHFHTDPRVEKKEWLYPYDRGDGSGQRVM